MVTTGRGSNFLARGLRRAAAAALLALGGGPATAAAPAEPPMWVVRDADSTLYLFGTVHLLDPAIQWRTSRVLNALEEARQLWVEVDIAPGSEVALSMAMLKKAESPGAPLSSRLTGAERAQLQKLLARTPDGQALGAVIERTKPWFAIVMLSVTPLIAAGHDPEAGADKVLSRLAREQGDEIRAFETAEQQLDWLASGTEEEQLAALKKLLALPEAQFVESMASMDDGVRAWMRGDIAPLEAYIENWRKGGDDAMAGMSYDTMIVRRNENWADQLEQLLKGSGVAFVAVGSGHLIGRDSMLARLAARGIEVRRY